jgi:hypothetical protein
MRSCLTSSWCMPCGWLQILPVYGRHSTRLLSGVHAGARSVFQLDNPGKVGRTKIARNARCEPRAARESRAQGRLARPWADRTMRSVVRVCPRSVHLPCSLAHKEIRRAGTVVKHILRAGDLLDELPPDALAAIRECCAGYLKKGKFSDFKRAWVDMVVEHWDDARRRERGPLTGTKGRDRLDGSATARCNRVVVPTCSVGGNRPGPSACAGMRGPTLASGRYRTTKC